MKKLTSLLGPRGLMAGLAALALSCLLALPAAPALGALSYDTPTRQARCNTLLTQLGASAVLEIRSGSQPTSTAGAATLPTATGTLLATITMGSTVGTCTDGVLTFNTGGASQTAGSHVSGTPGHMRMKTSGGVARFDIPVCGSAPCWTFTGTVATGQTVTLTGLTLTEGNV